MNNTITSQKPFLMFEKGFQIFSVSLMLCCLTLFSSCEKEVLSSDSLISGQNDQENISVTKPDLVFYGLTSTGLIQKFNAMDPSKAISSATLSGLQSGEKLIAIDFRPATGQLYGLGNSSRIYVINYDTGAARAIGTGPFTPALDSDIAGFDFNPTVDRIRVVTNKGQNLRLNPETGMVAVVDGRINGVEGAMINGSAYRNNVAGAATTELYAIDIKTQTLYTQMPPNDGKLIEDGPLKRNFSDEGGFDISPKNIALAALSENKKSTLYLIDLESGKADKLGDIKDCTLIGLAIPTEPVAYAVCTSNELLIFNPTNPKPVVKPITGIQLNEKILGLDMRPVNGQLYALGSTSRIYTINASSGVATMVGSGPFSPALDGTDFGFDFNPVVDRIRIVSNTGQNLRINPITGVLAFVDGKLNPGTPVVTAAAYRNNFAGTTTTELYVLDTNTDKLFTQVPPNDGTLLEDGSLGVNADADNGFDIGGKSDKGYAILTVSGVTKIYEINLDSGVASPLSAFPSKVRGFAWGLGF